MRLWRISAFPGLTGQGGMVTSGRWHTAGRPVLYAAEHPALALIEVLAHLMASLDEVPINLKLIGIDVDANATTDPEPPLPSGWQANEKTSRAVGNAWLKDPAAGLMLKVPSAIIDHSTNYVIRANHPMASTWLSEQSIEPFWVDPRFLA